jgi:hypothetical protein
LISPPKREQDSRFEGYNGLSLSSRSFPFLSVWPGPGGWFPHAGGRIRSARRFVSVARFVSPMAPVTVLRSSISDHLIWPWSFALSLDAHSNYAWNFVAWFADRGSFQRRRAATGSSRPQLCCAKSTAEKLEQLAQRERSLPVRLRRLGQRRDRAPAEL